MAVNRCIVRTIVLCSFAVIASPFSSRKVCAKPKEQKVSRGYHCCTLLVSVTELRDLSCERSRILMLSTACAYCTVLKASSRTQGHIVLLT